MPTQGVSYEIEDPNCRQNHREHIKHGYEEVVVPFALPDEVPDRVAHPEEQQEGICRYVNKVECHNRFDFLIDCQFLSHT